MKTVRRQALLNHTGPPPVQLWIGAFTLEGLPVQKADSRGGLRAKSVTQHGLYLFTQVFAFIQLNYLKVSVAQTERGDSSPKLFGRREINSNE